MTPPTVRVFVEVPRFGLVKRERAADGSLAVDYVSPVPCPFNYGCLPDRVADDGDPPDAVVLGPRIPAGTEVEVPVWGVVRFLDDGKVDDKLVCGPERPTEIDRLQVVGFFKVYAVARAAMNLARGRTGRTAVLDVELDVWKGPQVVFSATNVGVAHLVFDRLQDAGLHPALRGELRPSYAGAIPMHDAVVEVVVPPDEAEEARALLAAIDEAAAAPDWECRACGETNPGNFGTCWKCRANRR